MFDNGRALFPGVGDSEVGEAEMLAAWSRPAFGADSFDGLAVRMMGERQRGWLARLAGTDVGATMEGVGMGEVRAHALAAFVRTRCERLLGVPAVPRDAIAELAEERFPDAVVFSRLHGAALRDRGRTGPSAEPMVGETAGGTQ